MKKPNIDEIFENLKFNTNVNELMAEFSEQEMEGFESAYKLQSEIEDLLGTTLLNKSKIASILIFYGALFENSGITKDNIQEKILDDDSKYFLGLFLNLLDKIFTPDKDIIRYKELIDLIKEHQIKMKLPSKHFIDLHTVFSAFWDYHVITEITSSIKKLDSKYKQDFNEIIDSIIKSIVNASKFIHKDLEELTKKKATVQDKRTHTTFYLTTEMIDCIKKDLEIYSTLNKKIFMDSLSNETLDLIANLIMKFKYSDIETKIFPKLDNFFGINSAITKYRQKLLLHEIFVFYNHPSVISRENEASATYSAMSIKELNLAKIRKVEALLK